MLTRHWACPQPAAPLPHPASPSPGFSGGDFGITPWELCPDLRPSLKRPLPDHRVHDSRLVDSVEGEEPLFLVISSVRLFHNARAGVFTFPSPGTTLNVNLGGQSEGGFGRLMCFGGKRAEANKR